MANILCPWCGGPIAVDRGVRRRGVVYCCQGCASGTRCERPECPRPVPGAKGLPDVSLPETRER